VPHTRSTDAHATTSHRRLVAERIGLLDTFFDPEWVSLLVTKPEVQIQVEFKVDAPLRLYGLAATLPRIAKQQQVALKSLLSVIIGF